MITGMRAGFLLSALFFFPLLGSATWAAGPGDPTDVPQDPFFYFPKSLAERGLVSPEDQAKFDREFNRSFFAPWHREAAGPEKEVARERFRTYEKDPGYDENQIRHAPEWAASLSDNAGLGDYPNAGFKGITTAHTDIRELPTDHPHFREGEGYPFDGLQYSAVPANTPVFVSHLSRDKIWALADSHYGKGWIPLRDIASADEALISAWESSPLIAVTREESTLSGPEGVLPFRASVGCLFPKFGETEKDYLVLAAVSGGTRKALIRKMSLPKKSSALKPLKLNPRNAALLMGELLNRPYGWGGMYGHRDCSATLKDFFTPFGVWLPRDSKDQAHRGRFVSLKGLASREKEKTILKEAEPFLTLIYMKGHIMLYLGNHEGKAAVFHNVWGFPVQGGNKIIGRSVISTLYAATDQPTRHWGLLAGVESMTFPLSR